LSEGNLVYSGKLMGLSSYGNVISDWLPYFIQFYKMGPNGPNYQFALDLLAANISRGGHPNGKIEIKFDTNNRISGQIAYDIAATSQRAFEECFLEVAKPYFAKYPNLSICMTGGCALNIILNTRIVQEFNKEVFVGPNPNDCGLAAGMLLSELKPENSVDLTYAGLPLLDLDMLSHHILSYPLRVKSSFLDKKVLAQDLFDGNIVGVARGNSEHGPRALGNRSILCNPTIVNMKDILNEKVKTREWYRPFAPVVRLEDVNKYFEWNRESRWMSFCPRVRPEWRETLTAITHIDGTARVQTVTREQNEWLYDLLTEFEQLSGIGVLLNTSFNVNGKPILSSISDAFTIFEKTRMDKLVVEDIYFTKY
jgi:carbamoyltransferase